MRRLIAAVLASSIVCSNAFAVESGSNVALAPGKPAGVKTANASGNGFLLIAGIAIVAGGIALVASSGSSGNAIAVTTTGTAP